MTTHSILLVIGFVTFISADIWFGRLFFLEQRANLYPRDLHWQYDEDIRGKILCSTLLLSSAGMIWFSLYSLDIGRLYYYHIPVLIPILTLIIARMCAGRTNSLPN